MVYIFFIILKDGLNLFKLLWILRFTPYIFKYLWESHCENVISGPYNNCNYFDFQYYILKANLTERFIKNPIAVTHCNQIEETIKESYYRNWDTEIYAC